MQTKSFTHHRGAVPTVGFLVDWLQDSYQCSILRGAADAARDRRANLLCFTGGIIGAPGRARGAARDGVFDLVSTLNVDALVVLSGTVGNHIGAERLRAYCERFRPLPMCSVALDLEGLSSVCIDNDVGMRQVLGHLVRHHQLKRIAFVRGPEANVEAERRFAIYQQTLAEAQIAFDPRLVAPGDFQAASGQRAVELFFDQRRLAVEDIEAIACANDNMALGVLEELDRRGIRVPDRIALVGFDDIEEVRFTTPPLTTVSQPLRRQGREAVSMVLDQIRGGARVQKVVLDTELVTRRSCRCFMGRRADAASIPPPTPSGMGFESMLLGRRQIILADLSRASRGAFSAAGVGWEQRLLSAFGDQLRGSSPAAFVETYEDILRKLSQGGVDLSICYDVAATLRRHLLACVANQRYLRPLAEEMLDEIGERTGNLMERAQAWHRIHIQRRARSLGLAGATMVTTFDLGDLAAAVRESLPILGIESCYVSVFEAGDGPAREARLILAYRGPAEETPTPGLAVTYRADEIVPDAVLPAGREHAFVVAPLLFREEELGLLVLQLGAADGHVYEALRELFAAAIKGARLVESLGDERRQRGVALAEVEETRARLAALGPVQETLAAAIRRCRALAAEGSASSLEVGSIEAELERARQEITQIVAPSALAAPPR